MNITEHFPLTICRTLFDNEIIGFHITSAKHGSSLPLAVCDGGVGVEDKLQILENAVKRANSHAQLVAALKKVIYMLDRYAHEDRHTDTHQWHSGDGPYEQYCLGLFDDAEKILDEANTLLSTLEESR